MRTIAVTFTFVILLLLLFIVAIATGTPALAIVPFCLWTPAIAIFGWSVGRAGLKLALTTVVTDSTPTVKPIQQRKSRIRETS